jgi:hypothetical protein
MSPLKKLLARSESPRSANRADIGISSSFFSIGYGSPAAALHMSTSFSRINPLFSRASKSSVFAFDFIHSRFGSGRGGDTGGDVPAADPEASSRLLFFPLAAFAVLDGDGFILQVGDMYRRDAIKKELAKLLAASFIREVFHHEWLANPVLVRTKNLNEWRMCVDYTDLNKHCPKDPFELPRIDQVIDSTAGCDLLCFLDCYSGYH